jgi:rhodanese-related sulfurtransferase
MLLFVNLGCAQSDSKPITKVSQEELKKVVLVDVRTPEEFTAGHLDNATNINWYDTDFADRFKAIDKDKTIYVYCKMGVRSLKAQEKLKSLGYHHVVNLEGGYDAWKKANQN